MMSYHQAKHQAQYGGNAATNPGHLKYTASNASTVSSAYSTASTNASAPSRTNTMSSAASSTYSAYGAGHKRGISEISPTRPADRHLFPSETASGYKSVRQSLRSLPQAPNSSPPPLRSKFEPSQHDTLEHREPTKCQYDGPASSPPTNRHLATSQASSFLSRGGSVSPMTSSSHRVNQHQNFSSPHSPAYVSPDLTSFKNSSTSHLKTLSKYAQTDSSEDFFITSPAPSVAGLSGRRRLKRATSRRTSRGTGLSSTTKSSTWAENVWMEKQRQFLQAYEYLCHIGEAKEWIEDITHEQLPPIVQLEEALRNGVILADVVQAFYPDQPMRIFRNQKLQFRHSDNIALFFRFLADMQLPELFRFELVDLYEKKNIPKVIYCIHALSWLLFRKGLVDFRIGNLVGQLEFEHHELEEMQKGLDKAGVNMPSFAGMGASFGVDPEPEPEPEPEPVETEDERVKRELSEQESTILDFQSQIRGAVMRLRLGNMMQELWDSETRLVELQSIIRGRWGCEVAEYRISTSKATINVQSAVRGFLERYRQAQRQIQWKRQEKEVLELQSFARAMRSRIETQRVKTELSKHIPAFSQLQAVLRGATQRIDFNKRIEETTKASKDVSGLQASIRAMLSRMAVQRDLTVLRSIAKPTIDLQACCRGQMLRRQLAADQEKLLQSVSKIRLFQAAVRGSATRSETHVLENVLHREANSISRFQAIARGCSQRRLIANIQSQLELENPSILAIQALTRGHLRRNQFRKTQQTLQTVERDIVELQSYLRGSLIKSSCQRLQERLEDSVAEISSLQALLRAMLIRLDVGSLLMQLEDEEVVIAELQAAIRGSLVRAKFAEKKRYFQENMQKVVKLQSFVRGRLQGEQYKSLTTGNNPPVGTVKNFVHLLNDSDFDFDEEVEFERIRKTVVQHVRQNEMADQYISQLDIKIALLVKNKITLDEVVKHQRHFGSAAGNLLTSSELSSKDPFDLKALNKNSRRKLEQYQELFFILQTQSQYLARIFRRLREQATAEREVERVKNLIMGLFGFAQKRREEYYLLKLIARSLREEIDHCHSLQDYLRGNFFLVKLFHAYTKSPRDRKFMRETLGPIIRENIIDNEELNLESDPMQIYLSAIENEQLRTGQRSQRNPDIPREAAIRDPETKRTFITHLQDLRDITDQFFLALDENFHKVPFGVRFIAQQMYQMLTARFSHEEPRHILQLVGHWLWKHYLLSGLTEPEKSGVVDRGLSQEHRRNVGEVAKVLGQVAAGRLFGGENVFLQPLNSYVGESIQRLSDTWERLLEVSDAESHFDIDEFNDLYSRTKPTLYIKMADIFSIHRLVAADAASICPSRDDILQEVVRDLGSVKNNESELRNVSSSEICLTLNPKLHESEGKLHRPEKCAFADFDSRS